MELSVYNKEGKKVGTHDVPENLFNLPKNNSLVHQVYVAKWSNKRNVIAHAKTRAEVRGGGRKPWRQKGTGRARHGSRRSPIWVGGGVTFGPTRERNYSKKVNKKMNAKAMFTVLSNKLKTNNIFVIDDLGYKEAKTKLGATLLKNMDLDKGSNVVYGTKKDNEFKLVFRNIAKTDAYFVNNVNIIDILQKQNVIFSKTAVDELVKIYATRIKDNTADVKVAKTKTKTKTKKALAK